LKLHDTWDYEENEDEDTVIITKYNGGETEVDIPEELDGKTVTTIGTSAFWEQQQITKINYLKAYRNGGIWILYSINQY
jgi:hypothetical protein